MYNLCMNCASLDRESLDRISKTSATQPSRHLHQGSSCKEGNNKKFFQYCKFVKYSLSQIDTLEQGVK